ncbi:uncharacterized protein [Mytilus edulis]|uniref:uncharacterized protein n=1 Tax=Mytilus edulis TaxID=6550 RepID=UPI0039F0F7B9
MTEMISVYLITHLAGVLRRQKMSILHRKLPHIINLVDEVDTIIIDQTEAGNGRTSSSGEFIISDGVIGDNRIVKISPNNEHDEGHHLDAHMIIMDDQGNILLKGVHIKQKCLRTFLNIYSPAGFILGSVREREPR